MANIENSDGAGAIRAFNYGPDHPAVALWMAPECGLLYRISRAMAQRSAHPARTVVLLPYAQLLPLAQRLWAQWMPDGFAPRFETTQNWSIALGSRQCDALDLTFEHALDVLTAADWLQRAGLAHQRDALAGLLVESAYALAPLAAAVPPAMRSAWADACRSIIAPPQDAPAIAWEAAVMRLALEWVAMSGYASDPIFSADVQRNVDCLVIVQGLNPDPLVEGLVKHWGERAQALALAPMDDDVLSVIQPGGALLHASLDAEDEAQRATACALKHIQSGVYPVALVSADRALTRRIRAMLESAGVAMRDENGWKLSTTRAAAGVIALLKASVWNASCDAVLNWLKSAPALTHGLDDLEATLRRDAVRDWASVTHSERIISAQSLLQLLQTVELIRARFNGRKTWSEWLCVLRDALHNDGQWEVLESDVAGCKVLQTLRLSEAEPGASLDTWDWHGSRVDLSAFTHWVNQLLEGAQFKPDYPRQEEVVILPLSQMLGRPFAAVVLAGCDEVRLNPDAALPGCWTSAQRKALGLPSREIAGQRLRLAWHYALQTPCCDIVWRTSDDAGEALSPSVLVQALQSAAVPTSVGVDPREERSIDVVPTLPTKPHGQALPVTQLTASAYQSLRECPYQFFALRQLGLFRADELESEVDKRDFGVWLHAVLHRFHSARQGPAQSAAQDLVALLDHCAQEVTQSLHLAQGEFLPYAASWPAVRDGYLQWLQGHEAQGAVYQRGEDSQRQPLGPLMLVGRLDRVDRLSDGLAMVLDYKTESISASRLRVKDPLEDTQIAFYAALLPEDTLRAGYLNISEKGTEWCEQKDIVAARDALLEGIQVDMQRVGEGAPLPPLGEGVACDYCDARGLCRKDFWSTP